MKNLTIENFFEEDKVFKDASVFSPHYLPDAFKYREEEFKKIGSNLKGIIDYLPTNMYISGPPGTGKTHITKRLIQEFNNYCKRKRIKTKFLYVNCRTKTYPRALCTLLEQFQKNVPYKGFSSHDLLDKILRHLKGYNVCFIFDEMDRLLPSAKRNVYEEVIGTFTRLSEYDFDGYTSLAIIANNPNVDEKIDASAQSSFIPVRVRFKEYQLGEINEIIMDRCRKGFKKGVINTNTVMSFSKEIKNSAHDLRTAFRVLLNAGKVLKNKGNNGEITSDLLKYSFEDVERLDLNQIFLEMNDLQIILLYIIANIQHKKMKAKKKNDIYVTTNEIWRGYQSFVKDMNKKLKEDKRNHRLQEKSQRHLFEYVLPRLESQGFFTTDKTKTSCGLIKIFSMQETMITTIRESLEKILQQKYQDWY